VAVVTGGDRRPILATGMHRSGTSWLGHMLCAGGSLTNIEETLSPLNRQTVLPSRERRWYPYICDENEDHYLPFYRDALAFRRHPLNDMRRMRFASRDPIRVTRCWASFGLGRLQLRSPLLRDPFAVFSIDWFARRLNCEVVVIVRHPAAVVSSLKRLGYTFDFRDLLEQPLLMKRLERFRPAMENALALPKDVIHQGSLLWRMIYDTLNDYRDIAGRINIVRHEDLSLNPLEEYARLYECLHMPFTAKARAKILQFTHKRNPREVSTDNPFETRLDSRANLDNWRHRLDPEEIERIRVLTSDAAIRFYADDDWIRDDLGPSTGASRGAQTAGR
jgi:hypothetical protein